MLKKVFPLAVLFVVVAAALNAPAAEKIPTGITDPNDLPIAMELPKEAPFTAVAITDFKGNLLALEATMKDGTIVSFDKRSTVSWKEQVQWALQAPHSVTIAVAPLSDDATSNAL